LLTISGRTKRKARTGINQVPREATRNWPSILIRPTGFHRKERHAEKGRTRKKKKHPKTKKVRNEEEIPRAFTPVFRTINGEPIGRNQVAGAIKSELPK